MFQTTTFAPLLVSRRCSQRKSQFETTNQNMSNHIDMLLLNKQWKNHLQILIDGAMQKDGNKRDLVHHRTNVSICFDNPKWNPWQSAKLPLSEVPWLTANIEALS